LIMVLTVTSAAGLTVADGREGVRQLLFAAIGCNIAWGIIDAVMYIMNSMTVRAGSWRLAQRIKNAPNEKAALDLIEAEVAPELQDFLAPKEAETLRQAVLKSVARTPVAKAHATRDDFYGAIACFWLVFVSCLPAALPFFVFSRPRFALRVSNFLLIVLLFLVGRAWAKYVGANRLLAGSAMVAIGLALVGIAVLLGG